MRITVAGLKGGTGKTTVSVLLAEVLAERAGDAGRVVLVDTDPQGSAMRWADLAAEEGPGLRCLAVSLPTADLGRRLPAVTGGAASLVLDTPPGSLPIASAAVRAADVVIVPARPSLADLDRVAAAVTLAEEWGRPALAVLTNTRAGTRSAGVARAALNDAGIPVASAAIPTRESIAAAFGTRPGADVLDHIGALADEVAALSTGGIRAAR